MSNLSLRRAIERFMAQSFIDLCLKAEYTITVDNGYTYWQGKALRWESHHQPDVLESTDVKAIMEEMFACDEADLFIHRPGTTTAWAKFIWGNSGPDCLSDYSTSLEDPIGNAMYDLYRRIDDGHFDIVLRADVEAKTGA